MINFIYFTIYWILDTSYAKFHYNLSKQTYLNKPLNIVVLSRKNYLKVMKHYFMFIYMLYSPEIVRTKDHWGLWLGDWYAYLR